jgi:hypothetical protein
MPKRPDILAQWSRAAFPLAGASSTGLRRERLVKAIADAMQRPLPRPRLGPSALRRFVVTAAAAVLVVMVVGTVMARTGGGSLAARVSSLFWSPPSDRFHSHALPAATAPPAEVPSNTMAVPSNTTIESETNSVAPTSTSETFVGSPVLHRSAAREASSSTAASSTNLAEQNRLFAEAMTARRRGDRDRALQVLEQLIAKYPRSPLAQDACVERFRILAQGGDREAAARAARAYLASYAQGFATVEAQRLARLATDGSDKSGAR